MCPFPSADPALIGTLDTFLTKECITPQDSLVSEFPSESGNHVLVLPGYWINECGGRKRESMIDYFLKYCQMFIVSPERKR